MALPDYQSLMLPLLRILGDKKEHNLSDVVDRLAGEFQLTEEERSTLLPSGNQEVFRNRVSWARTYLSKAGLMEATRRSYFTITARGMDVLRANPTNIDNKYLMSFPEFAQFKERSPKEPVPDGQKVTWLTINPEESLEHFYQFIRNELARDLLDRIAKCSPTFFERLVVDLLVAMGYGSSRADAGAAIGRSGDEGIDGVIKEDRLGLDVLYIQAKRWAATVGRPEIQKFVGALHGKRAKKGVFITTSDFSKEARDYIDHIDCKVVLISGDELAEFMIDHNIGVAAKINYEVKTVIGDYFEE